MPKVSHFMGFEAPTDEVRWNQALMKASRGEQVLLERVLRVLKNPNMFFQVSPEMNWIFHNQDAKEEGGANVNMWGKKVPSRINHGGGRAPIVMLGNHKFEKRYYEGGLTSIITLGPEEVVKTPEKWGFKDKIVALGLPNENWGWASTQFLNRSVSWRISLGPGDIGPLDKRWKYPDELLQSFLDKDDLIALFVNQHHNLSCHPKVLSTPLGIQKGDGGKLWDSMRFIGARNITKDPRRLLLSMGSDYAFRPAIRACVSSNVPRQYFDTGQNAGLSKTLNDHGVPLEEGNEKKSSESGNGGGGGDGDGKEGGKVGLHAFRGRLATSYAVLCMPGLGGDSYRVWESLALGAMPVMEKGMGLDRTVYKLPVLLVEDFASVTEALLREAYAQAMYIALDPCADDANLHGTPQCMSFEYERITTAYWENLIYEVSLSRSLDAVLAKHPMAATDTGFTRPLVPFYCDAGCGPGTKRTPSVSCGIDTKRDFATYKFNYP